MLRADLDELRPDHGFNARRNRIVQTAERVMDLMAYDSVRYPAKRRIRSIVDEIQWKWSPVMGDFEGRKNDVSAQLNSCCDKYFPVGEVVSPTRRGSISNTGGHSKTPEKTRMIKVYAHTTIAEELVKSEDSIHQTRMKKLLTVLHTDHSGLMTLENELLHADIVLEEDVAGTITECYEHYCNLGDRANTEWMGCSKWIRFCLEMGLKKKPY